MLEGRDLLVQVSPAVNLFLYRHLVQISLTQSFTSLECPAAPAIQASVETQTHQVFKRHCKPPRWEKKNRSPPRRT